MKTINISLTALAAFTLLTPLAAGAQRAPSRSDTPIRTTPFPDVPENHWAFDAVESLRKKGILRGYPPAVAPASRNLRTHVAGMARGTRGNARKGKERFRQD